jgi:hypothetical protein
MNQLTIEQRSLWRIQNHYISESSTEEERVFWKNLVSEKENYIKELKELIKKVTI